MTEALEGYRYADAARVLYDFAWDEFCSFYVEMVKARLAEPATRTLAQRVLAHALDTLLRLLHPMMPFITEEVWQLLAECAPSAGLSKPASRRRERDDRPLADGRRARQDPEIEARFARFQEVLGGLARSSQPAEHSRPRRRSSSRSAATRDTAKLLQPMAAVLRVDGRRDRDRLGTERAAARTVGQLHRRRLRGVRRSGRAYRRRRRDRPQRERAGKAPRPHRRQREQAGQRELSARAPADVVAREREQLAELRDRLASTTAALADLKSRERN